MVLPGGFSIKGQISQFELERKFYGIMSSAMSLSVSAVNVLVKL